MSIINLSKQSATYQLYKKSKGYLQALHLYTAYVCDEVMKSSFAIFMGIFLQCIRIQEAKATLYICWVFHGTVPTLWSHISSPIHLSGIISDTTIVYSSCSADVTDDSMSWIKHWGSVIPLNGPMAAHWPTWSHLHRLMAARTCTPSCITETSKWYFL